MAQHDIVSPLPGTVYRRSSPDAAPFVEVGVEIEEGATVGLVEVMKQFSEIESTATGRVTEILAEDGDPVDAGQVLMRVEE
jgi:acetyl-CoA carboxylase biotin carboxyl carrier protein